MIYVMQRQRNHALTELNIPPPSSESLYYFYIQSFSEIVQTAQPSKELQSDTSTESGFLSKQLDLLPSFSPKHTIYHLTTNYHFSHVTVACFTLCNLSLSTPNKSRQEQNWRVKPAYTLQSHNGALLLLTFFLVICLILNYSTGKILLFFKNKRMKGEGTALRWWRNREAGFTPSNHQQRQSLYLVSEEELQKIQQTWSAGTHKEKETE